MSRMLAALKKLEKKGQLAPEEVAGSAPTSPTPRPLEQTPAAAHTATSVLAPPAPPCEKAEPFSGDPAEDYGRDLQCIEEQLAWAEMLRAELMAAEQQDEQAEAEAVEACPPLPAAPVADLDDEEDDEPTVLDTPNWESTALAEVAAEDEEEIWIAPPVEIEPPPTPQQRAVEAPRGEAELPWVAQPLAPMPRREGPLKVPFGAPHAPTGPPLQAQPTEPRPERTAPLPPPSEPPESDALREEPVAEPVAKAAPVEPAEAQVQAEPLVAEPCIVEPPVEKRQVEEVVAKASLPAQPVSFGPPLEPAEREAMFTPARGEEREQLVATCDRLLALLAEREARVCLLNSVGTGEAAPRLAVQLAMQAVERVEQRVLVVEGDLAQRRISRATVDLPCEFGGTHDSYGARVLAQVSPRLMLLPAAEGESAEAYRKRIVAHLCRHLGRYSLVLIEGGGENTAEIPEIAAICDAAVLHVPLGEVEIPQTQAALGKLHSWGVTVVGTIVTGASAAEASEPIGESPALA